jgi:hypothetical protein
MGTRGAQSALVPGRLVLLSNGATGLPQLALVLSSPTSTSQRYADAARPSVKAHWWMFITRSAWHTPVCHCSFGNYAAMHRPDLLGNENAEHVDAFGHCRGGAAAAAAGVFQALALHRPHPQDVPAASAAAGEPPLLGSLHGQVHTTMVCNVAL